MDTNEFRADWEIDENHKRGPRAWHTSGLAFALEYVQAPDPAHDGWQIWSDSASESRETELRGEMGREAFASFGRELTDQLRALWFEMGYSNASRKKGG
jgi:hypothetical protein